MTIETATVFVFGDDLTNYLAYLAKNGMEITRQRKSADDRGWLITFNYTVPSKS